MVISKFVKADSNILLEYIYDDNNVISESYDILINLKDKARSFVSGSTSSSLNNTNNQLFKVDAINDIYGIVDTTGYPYLQFKEYAPSFPIKYDTIKIHMAPNYTFGEYLGCYIRCYAFDRDNNKTYDISNYYYEINDIDNISQLNYSENFMYNEKIYGKNITLTIPSVYDISRQVTDNTASPYTINWYLTEGLGLNQNTPVFIDFRFITKKDIISGKVNYYMTGPIMLSIPQAPENQNLGLVIQESMDGDYFEIYGTYNGNIAEFKQFIDNSKSIGNNYSVQYSITTNEQNVITDTFTILKTNNFNEMLRWRPIIYMSTTTAIINVEMQIIDINTGSTITRKGSYGMLQDQVSKYSISLTKINLANANKPKIYNIKNTVGAGIFDGTNVMYGKDTVTVELMKVPYPVLVDKYNIVGKSENAVSGAKTFFGNGLLKIILYPFDNTLNFTLAEAVSDTMVSYMNLLNDGIISLVFKNDTMNCQFDVDNSGITNLEEGFLTFKIPSSKINDIKKIYKSGNNLFYIVKTAQANTMPLYSGLYTMYDAADNITELNNLNNNIEVSPDDNLVVLDNTANKGIAIVTRTVTTSSSTSSLPTDTVLSSTKLSSQIKIKK